MNKKCNKCKEVKSVSKFYKRGDRTNGYKYICKVCDNELSAIRKRKSGYKYDRKRQGPGTKHSKLSKINSQKHRDEMSDMYIRSLIVKKSKSLKTEDIPDDLVNKWRINLALKRKLESIKKP